MQTSVVQSVWESVSQYHTRFLFALACDTPSETSTADTDHCYVDYGWSATISESIPCEVLSFIKGLKCPRCREFVVLRRPQTVDDAFLAASQFEFCYSNLPDKHVKDDTALHIMLSRSEIEPEINSSRSIGFEIENEAAIDEISDASKDNCHSTPYLAYHGPSTAYFNSLLGRLKAAGAPKHVIDQYQIAFADLHRNHFVDIDAGVREEDARLYLKKNRRYCYDFEKHQLHEYETHMTIKLAACTRLWMIGIKIPILALQIRKPRWMRRLFHKLPLILSSPGLSYNT